MAVVPTAGTSLLEKLVNPFGKCGAQKLFAALKSGPKKAKELVDSYRVCKTVRQISNIASFINRIDGMRVRCSGVPASDLGVWSMVVANPASILIPRDVLVTATPTPVDPFELPAAAAPTFKGEKIKLNTSWYMPPPDFGFVQDLLKRGRNVWLWGPSGSGKSAMGEEVAKALKAEFIRQNFNGETMVENMIGATRLGIEDGTSVTEWEDGMLARAVRLASKGKKVIYCADEVTGGKPDVLFQFHRVLETKPDGSREMEINGEIVTVLPGMLSIIATANSFRIDESGMYGGSNTMNEAFLNRFNAVVYCDYPPNEDEIIKRRGVDPKIAKMLQSFALGVRLASKEANYPIVLSTRQLVTIGEEAMIFGCRKALELCYLNRLLSDERKIVDPLIIAYPWPN